MRNFFQSKTKGIVLLFSLLLLFSFSFVSATTIINDTGISSFSSHITTTGYINASDWSDVIITESQISDLQSYLTSYTETDPKAYNGTLAYAASLDNYLLMTNQTLNGNYSFSVDVCVGGNCLSSVSGSGGGNTTEEMVDAVLSQANITITYNDASDSWGVNQTWLDAIITAYGYLTSYTETDPLWSENFTLYNNSWSIDTDTTYSHLSNFTDNLGDRGYTSLSNFTNDGVFITNATMNKTVSCSDIIGSPDTDFCTDATGGGAGASDQDLNTTSDVTFNSIHSKTYVTATNWTNVSITASQVSNFNQTVNSSIDLRVNQGFLTTILNSVYHPLWDYDFGDLINVPDYVIWANLWAQVYNETEVNNLLAAQDECSEINGCVTGALTAETDPYWSDNFTLYNTSWSTDTDTTYTAGSNLTLTGTTFAANMTSLKAWFDLFYQSIGTYLSNIVEDTTPQLGGTLDTNNNNITLGNNALLNQTGGARIYHNGTGWVIIG